MKTKPIILGLTLLFVPRLSTFAQTFTRIETGVIVNDGGNSNGGSWGDYDNDGDLDLFVVNVGQKNSLYQNNGNGTFTKMTSGTIVDDGGYSYGCSWGDYDNDGDLDLFVANVGFGQNNFLYQNNGDGTFTKNTSGAIVNDGGSSVGGSWADYDSDGDLDLFVANDFGQSNFLYRNNGGGVFTKITSGAIVNEAADSQGGSWGDYDNDSDLDLFVTNCCLAFNFLYQNNGDGTFNKVAGGAIVNDFGSFRGSSWGDYDNDGDLDLFVTTEFHRNNFLYQNNGNGSFTQITSGAIVNDFGSFSGCSWADYDNDGDLDLFVANDRNRKNLLYQNNGNGNSWVDIRLLGTTSNTAAIGAKVKLKAAINGPAQGGIWQMQEVSGQTGYLSQNSLNAEFGLGKATLIDSIRIEWPSGEVNTLTNVPVNQFISIKENRRPRIKNKITDIILSKTAPHFIGDLDTVFVDLDKDTLIYSVASDNPRIAAASISKSLLTVALVSDTTSGRAKVEIIADDGKSNNTKVTFDINRPPFLRQIIPDTILPIGGRFLRFDLPAIFIDPELDPLTFKVGNANESVAIALISEGSLFIFALNTGKTQITVTAEDGRGGKTALQFDVSATISLAPVIVHDHSKIDNVKVGDAIQIDVEVRDDDNPVARPFLRYRPAGEIQPFLPVGMDSLAGMKNIFRGTIPGSAVTNHGVEYYIEATDIHGVHSRYPTTGLFSVHVRVDGIGVKNTRPEPSGNEQTSYHLFSIPLEVDKDKRNPRTVLEDDLGAYNIKKWRFYELTSDLAGVVKNVEFPDTTDLAPGKAFWLIVKESGKFITTGPGTTVLTSSPYTIALHKGWNLVGNPFNFPAYAEDKSSDGRPLNFFAYEAGGWSAPFAAVRRAFQPFEGYAVHCSTACTMFINPNRFSAGSPLSKEEITEDDEALWSIRIMADCQEARDENNFATVIQQASRENDRIDQPEPPVIGEYVSVYFPHKEWNTLAKTYCLDARPEPVEGEVWEFEVKTNIRDKVNLTFEGIDEVPEELEVWLVDDALKITQNLRETNHYAVAGSEQPKPLKLVVGKHDFVGEKLAGAQPIPTTYELSQNFPNPFNPATTIRYGLPQAERVTLKIYNLLGEEVALIMNDELRAAGYHAAIWDGRDKTGKVAASGVYVYRLQAGSAVIMTKKLALVK